MDREEKGSWWAPAAVEMHRHLEAQVLAADTGTAAADWYDQR